MRKIMLLLALMSFVHACKDPIAEGPAETDEVAFFSLDSLPKRVPLNARALEVSQVWVAFKDLDTGFDALSTVENYEDLILVMEDLVAREKKLEESKYPEEFDLPQVKSRQKVMKTFILKTRAAAEYRIEATPPAVEMMKAYNAMRAQLNVIVNNQLDTELLSDE
jgi:hypothetical protein